MGGTKSGIASNTYPADWVASLGNNPPSGGASPLTVTTIPTMYADPSVGIAGYPTYGSFASNELTNGSIYYTTPTSSGLINGSVTTHIDGQLVYYFLVQWSGGGAPTSPLPTTISPLLNTNLFANVQLNYGSSKQTSGLSASASAADKAFNETASSTGPTSVIGYHLVQASVSPLTATTGIAETYLNGTVDQTANDPIPAAAYAAGHGYYPTNGPTTARANSEVSAGVRPSSSSLGAHSTVDTSVPGNPWDPAHPRFFSGTNCSATGIAVALSGYVSEAHLVVGGTDVKDYYDTSFAGPLPQGAVTGTNQTSASLTVHFDSTQFSDSSSIPIQMSVTDTAGNKYDANVKANAYNKGYVGYEPTRTSYGQATAAVVDQVLAQSNIKNNDSTTSDTRDAVLAAVTTNTDFFTYNYGQHYPDSSNHLFFEPPAGVGNSNGVLYGNQSFDPTSTAQNPRNDIAEAVAGKGINPPPYNFVYLDICNGGYDSEFADGFGVSASGNTDRAFLGWNGWVEDSAVNQNWTQRLYSYLQTGQTLVLALAYADKIPGGPPYDNNSNSPNYQTACPHVVKGDGNMTLHGAVYQGTQWFR